MSQQNVELLHQAYDAINRRDFSAFLALMDADVEAVPRMVAIEGGYHGHDGLRRWWGQLVAIFPDIAIETVEVRDLGDMTLAAVRIRGHGAGSDTPLDVPLWNPAKWRGGKCLWWANYGTEAEALEAAGRQE